MILKFKKIEHFLPQIFYTPPAPEPWANPLFLTRGHQSFTASLSSPYNLSAPLPPQGHPQPCTWAASWLLLLTPCAFQERNEGHLDFTSACLSLLPSPSTATLHFCFSYLHYFLTPWPSSTSGTHRPSLALGTLGLSVCPVQVSWSVN